MNQQLSDPKNFADANDFRFANSHALLINQILYCGLARDSPDTLEEVYQSAVKAHAQPELPVKRLSRALTFDMYFNFVANNMETHPLAEELLKRIKEKNEFENGDPKKRALLATLNKQGALDLGLEDMQNVFLPLGTLNGVSERNVKSTLENIGVSKEVEWSKDFGPAKAAFVYKNIAVFLMHQQHC